MPSVAVLSPYYHKAFHLLKSDGKKKCREGLQNSPCCSDSQDSKGFLFRLVLRSQTVYAQYMKLVTLFVIAVVHAVYMIPFLDTFTALASHVDTADLVDGTGSFHLRHLVETLSDYKKNMWMIVGSMCVALSTSCFILLLNASSRKVSYDVVVRGIDLLTFGTLPIFLFARLILLSCIHEQLPSVLNKLQYAEYSRRLSAALHCSFIHVKQVIKNSLFPVFIIKFLIILAILTIAYLLLAYLIEWCLRHWFPPRCGFSTHAPVYVPFAMNV